VLAVACVVLWIEPAQGRVVALGGGLATMLTINLVLMRRAVRPLLSLSGLMRDVDPLDPGQRIALGNPDAEVAVLADAFNEMLDRLEGERRESGRRALLAQESERLHLARELHDDIGQSLTALVLELDHAEVERPAARQQIEQARQTAEQLVEEVRTLAQRLRPDVLDTLGLVPALANLVERTRSRAPLELRWVAPSSQLPPLPDDVELCIYRVAQEALTNVLRHAGATRAEVALSHGPVGVELRVTDDGRGIDRSAGADGTGLRSMRERALLAGGRVEVRAGPAGAGTQVRLLIPERELAPLPER
jgi:two-component system, NarL family, sensor histidine kinase UhpB